jgi:glycogen debranching enzyme
MARRPVHRAVTLAALTLAGAGFPSSGSGQAPGHPALPFTLAERARLPEHPAAPDVAIPEYAEIQHRLTAGWGTWDSRSVLRWVHLPEAFALNLGFKQHWWLDEGHLTEVLIGRGGEGAERVVPGPRTYDGGYAELVIHWRELEARVQSATDGDDLVVLVTPLRRPAMPVKLVIEPTVLWNRPGRAVEAGDGAMILRSAEQEVAMYVTAPAVDDPFVRAAAPHRVVPLTTAVGVSTGRSRSLSEIRALIERARERLHREAARFGDLAEAYLAVQAGLAWNTIYEPRRGRVVSTVGRLWNEEYGGSALFGWDNFFLAYMTGLSSRDLAFANVFEHLQGLTPDGFIPNDNRGNGSKSWDRSQPPVGGIMVREIYKTYPERWFLEAVFDALLTWNRWWPTARLNEGLLSYGSHEAKNPFREPAVRTVRTAGYETGMDDSPMYDGVPFDSTGNTLEIQDVGLNSLYIADCLALADLAGILGRELERDELRERAETFSTALDGLWDEESGYYLNYRTDLDAPSHRRSPTLFYPLLAGVPDAVRARRIVDEHLLNPEEFWGEWVLPSISRDDPDFPRQRYWKGAIWPPLNFLTFLGLRRAGFPEVAAELSRTSLAMFLSEWRRKGYVSENYSSITGTGDDERLSSDNFHSWGALFGIMAFIEAGFLPAPEAGL